MEIGVVAHRSAAVTALPRAKRATLAVVAGREVHDGLQQTGRRAGESNPDNQVNSLVVLPLHQRDMTTAEPPHVGGRTSVVVVEVLHAIGIADPQSASSHV